MLRSSCIFLLTLFMMQEKREKDKKNALQAVVV